MGKTLPEAGRQVLVHGSYEWDLAGKGIDRNSGADRSWKPEGPANGRLGMLWTSQMS
jgi:hypothetical protein